MATAASLLLSKEQSAMKLPLYCSMKDMCSSILLQEFYGSIAKETLRAENPSGLMEVSTHVSSAFAMRNANVCMV